MKKNYYAKVLALTVAASMVSVPAFAAEDVAPAAQEQGKEGENEQISKDSEEETKEQTIKGETPATEPTTQVTTGDEAITITPQSEGGVISEDTEDGVTSFFIGGDENEGLLECNSADILRLGRVAWVLPRWL